MAEIVSYICDCCGDPLKDVGRENIHMHRLIFHMGWDGDPAGGSSTPRIEQVDVCHACAVILANKLLKPLEEKDLKVILDQLRKKNKW